MMRQRNEFEKEFSEDEMFAVMKEIEEGLESIERSAPVYTPNLEWFENLVIEEKQTLRKKLIFDVVAFTLVSVLILSTVLFLLSRIPVIFIAAQGIITVFIFAYFTIKYVKQVKET